MIRKQFSKDTNMKLSSLTLFSLLAFSSLQAQQLTWYDEPGLYEGPTLSFETYLKKAEDNLADKDYKEAAEYYDKALDYLKNSENRAQAFQLAADNYNKAGELDKAVKRYAKLIEEYPQYTDYNKTLVEMVKIADIRTKEEQESSAFFRDMSKPISYYETVISNAPYSNAAPALMLKVARLQMEDDEPESSIATYRSIIKRHPFTVESGEARYAVADFFLTEYKTSGANLVSLIEAKKQLLFLNDEFREHDKLEPSRVLLEEIYNLEAKRFYELGEFYLRKAHYRPKAAKDYLYKVVINYKKSKYAESATAILKHYDEGDFPKNVLQAKEREERLLAKEAIQEANEKAAAAQPQLPAKATDRSLRNTLIQPEDSDKFIIPVEDLELEQQEQK